MVRAWDRLRYGVVAGDVVAVLVAYTLAAKIRFGDGGILWSAELWPRFPLLALAIAAFTFFLAWQFGLYRSSALFGGHRVYPLILTVATYSVVTLTLLSYFVGGPPLVSRLWLVSSWAFSVIGLSANRLLWRRVALAWRENGALRRRVLIAGANRHGLAVAQQLHVPYRAEAEVLGFLDDYQRPGTEALPGLRILGHPGSVLEVAKQLEADEVIIIAGALAWESQRHLAELVTRPDSPIVAHISPTYYDLLTTSADLSHIAYVPVLTLHRTRLSGLNGLVKACVDRVGAALMLALASPALLYGWLAARRRGVSMLARDDAYGLFGQMVRVYGVNPDLRINPVFSRLPALLNVLRGELSLIGPRPVRSGEEDRYERWIANLLTMRPGLTGLWRFRDEHLPVDEAVALDLYYIRNYTLAMDLQILLNTARHLLRRLLGGRDDLARWTLHVSDGHRRHPTPAVPIPVALPKGVSWTMPARRGSGEREHPDLPAH